MTAKEMQVLQSISVLVWIFLIAASAQAKYSGGTGEPNDPYQIATAADLITLGETPEDYDKHFILTADIDLAPNLPGRKVFDRAVIAPYTDPTNDYLDGPCFTGSFDGAGHTISHLTIRGQNILGLFGVLKAEEPSGARIKNVGVVDVNITGSGNCVGGLVGYVGGNRFGTIDRSYSSGLVSGRDYVGGLFGVNDVRGIVRQCHSSTNVRGDSNVGGLVGRNGGSIHNCYSTKTVSGDSCVGGLVGRNWMPYWMGRHVQGHLVQCYSSSGVCGSVDVGGLVGDGYANTVTACFWDVQESGQTSSAAGTGKTTAEMQTAETFLEAGWDFMGETANGTDDIWKIAEGVGYPRLSWERYSGGMGEPNDPYQIATAEDLMLLGDTPEDYDKHFILTDDIDLDPNLPGRKVFDRAVIAPDVNDANWHFDGIPFTGVFDGNRHAIFRLKIVGGGYLGLFGTVESGAEVRDLGVVNVNIAGAGSCVGGLVGRNAGILSHCYSNGTVDANDCVGGLVGQNRGNLTRCWADGLVNGRNHVGGLVGKNFPDGELAGCYSVGNVNGIGFLLLAGQLPGVERAGGVGGLAGTNYGIVDECYSVCSVSGFVVVGGLVGASGWGRSIINSYSAGMVKGSADIGGLVGIGGNGVTFCFWDIEASGQAMSAGGTGKTTAEMQTAGTFLDAGWDFVGETANGTEDIWWILEGKDYPRLWWELDN